MRSAVGEADALAVPDGDPEALAALEADAAPGVAEREPPPAGESVEWAEADPPPPAPEPLAAALADPLPAALLAEPEADAEAAAEAGAEPEGSAVGEREGRGEPLAEAEPEAAGAEREALPVGERECCAGDGERCTLPLAAATVALGSAGEALAEDETPLALPEPAALADASADAAEEALGEAEIEAAENDAVGEAPALPLPPDALGSGLEGERGALTLATRALADAAPGGEMLAIAALQLALGETRLERDPAPGEAVGVAPPGIDAEAFGDFEALVLADSLPPPPPLPLESCERDARAVAL